MWNPFQEQFKYFYDYIFLRETLFKVCMPTQSEMAPFQNYLTLEPDHHFE